MCMPTEMICVCLLSSDLIAMGNTATIATRLTMLAYATTALLIALTLVWHFGLRKDKELSSPAA